MKAKSQRESESMVRLWRLAPLSVNLGVMSNPRRAERRWTWWEVPPSAPVSPSPGPHTPCRASAAGGWCWRRPEIRVLASSLPSACSPDPRADTRLSPRVPCRSWTWTELLRSSRSCGLSERHWRSNDHPEEPWRFLQDTQGQLSSNDIISYIFVD